MNLDHDLFQVSKVRKLSEDQKKKKEKKVFTQHWRVFFPEISWKTILHGFRHPCPELLLASIFDLLFYWDLYLSISIPICQGPLS